MDDLETIVPIFLFIGFCFIVGYLTPYVMGKIDDIKEMMKN
ncbi:MAG: hypothetical protein OEX98_04635 [Nitrosopumilus sp.]|nr:hypothetical protein [Nitrosopumilus sp.]